jgi:cytochrome c biogenesis protein
VRDTPAEPFRYLRIPADDEGSMDGWCGLRRGAGRPGRCEPRRCAATWRKAAIRRRPDMASSCRHGHARPGLFAGAEAPAKDGRHAARRAAGAGATSSRASVPEAERARISEVLLRILNGSLYELNALAREKARA